MWGVFFLEMTALGIFLPPCHICAARNSRRSRVQTLSLYACQEDLKSKDIIRSKPHNQHTAEREGESEEVTVTRRKYKKYKGELDDSEPAEQRINETRGSE